MPKRSTSGRVTKPLGRILARVRARAHLSQAEVARRMGTSQTAIARLEAGRQNPSVALLQAFASANGYCLEIGFLPVRHKQTGCVMVVHGE